MFERRTAGVALTGAGRDSGVCKRAGCVVLGVAAGGREEVRYAQTYCA